MDALVSLVLTILAFVFFGALVFVVAPFRHGISRRRAALVAVGCLLVTMLWISVTPRDEVPDSSAIMAPAKDAVAPANKTNEVHSDGQIDQNWKVQVEAAPRKKSTAESKALNVEIPRSIPGDKGKYFLLSAKRTGSRIVALHKRVGVSTVGWTLTETDCSKSTMREFGYSELAPDSIVRNPTKWFKLIEGSSKSDLAKFVCSRF